MNIFIIAKLCLWVTKHQCGFPLKKLVTVLFCVKSLIHLPWQSESDQFMSVIWSETSRNSALLHFEKKIHNSRKS